MKKQNDLEFHNKKSIFAVAPEEGCMHEEEWEMVVKGGGWESVVNA